MNYGRMFAGAVLLALGVVLALQAASVADAGDIIAAWWPVIFIAGAALMYLANPRQPLAPLVVGVIALTALMVTTGLVGDGVWQIVWPALLILVGLWFISGRAARTRAPLDQDHVRSFVLFSGSELASRSQAFIGGTVSSVFGGTELDLRDAGLADGAHLDVFTAFGGTEIRVPEGWNVVVSGIPLFGGFDNVTTKDRLAPQAPRLDIGATVIFGGLEVKH